MTEERLVHFDCINASNPYHECIEYCFKRIAESKASVAKEADLRDDKQFFIDHPSAVPISTAQGEELRKMIGAPAYIECSAKTQENVKAVFIAAIRDPHSSHS